MRTSYVRIYWTSSAEINFICFSSEVAPTSAIKVAFPGIVGNTAEKCKLAVYSVLKATQNSVSDPKLCITQLCSDVFTHFFFYYSISKENMFKKCFFALLMSS